VLPQRCLHLQLTVCSLLLSLLRRQPGPPLRQRRLLLQQQLSLAAVLQRQRCSSLRRQLHLALTLRCSSAQLLRDCRVLRQPPLQRHLAQPAVHRSGTGGVPLLADVYRLLHAAAAELQILTATGAATTAAAAIGLRC
jgi:hypothetical protein